MICMPEAAVIAGIIVIFMVGSVAVLGWIATFLERRRRAADGTE